MCRSVTLVKNGLIGKLLYERMSTSKELGLFALFTTEAHNCVLHVVSPLVIESSLISVRIQLEANRRASTDTWRRR
jgi:hypothetical protein